MTPKFHTLKNCPFCGHHAEIVSGHRNSIDFIKYAECGQCGAQGAKFIDRFSEIAKGHAVKAWNRRPAFRIPYSKMLMYIRKLEAFEEQEYPFDGDREGVMRPSEFLREMNK